MKNRTLPLNLHSISRKFKALPGPLSVTAIIFGIVPLWSLLFVHRPWEIFEHVAGWKGLVLIFNFWIGPFAIAMCAFTRHKFLIPLFLVEGCLMLLYAMIDLPGGSSQLLTLQIILVSGMFFFSYFLLRTDALYSLMHGDLRPWRDAPRIDVGMMVEISDRDGKKTTKVVLQNCSLTGMELNGDSVSLHPLMGEKTKKDQLDFALTFANKTYEFTSNIAWTHAEDGERRIGLHVLDKSAMAELFAAIPREEEEEKSELAQAFANRWQSKPFRQVAFTLWAILVISAFLAPSAKKHFALGASRTHAAETIKAGLGPIYRNR